MSDLKLLPREDGTPVKPESARLNIGKIIAEIFTFIGFIALLPLGGRSLSRSSVPDEGSFEMGLYTVVGIIVTVLVGGTLITVGAPLVLARMRPAPPPPPTAIPLSPEAAFALIRPLIETRLPEWRATAPTSSHRLTPSDIDLPAESGMAEIRYGCCADNGFYVYALEPTEPSILGDTIQTADAFMYTEHAELPEQCVPGEGWTVSRKTNLGGGWASATVFIAKVLLTETPPPTAVP